MEQAAVPGLDAVVHVNLEEYEHDQGRHGRVEGKISGRWGVEAQRGASMGSKGRTGEKANPFQQQPGCFAI